MATEPQANKARQEHGNDLVRRGVHAIGVEAGEAHGHKGFVVVAHVPPGVEVDLPASLATPARSGSVKVPLVVQSGEPLKPE